MCIVHYIIIFFSLIQFLLICVLNSILIAEVNSLRKHQIFILLFARTYKNSFEITLQPKMNRYLSMNRLQRIVDCILFILFRFSIWHTKPNAEFFFNSMLNSFMNFHQLQIFTIQLIIYILILGLLGEL